VRPHKFNSYMHQIQYRQQQVLYDKKWQTLLRRAWLFRHIPFIDAAFGSGSLALGNVSEDSDLDVLIAAQPGRIFTARAAAIIAFGTFGWRRSKLDHRESAADKVCLNHFVTPDTYQLTLEPNDYWHLLYTQLTPIYGQTALIKKFNRANSWAGISEYRLDARHKYQTASLFKRVLTSLLTSSLGDWLEDRLKYYQIKRIESGLPRPGEQRPSVIRAVASHLSSSRGAKRRVGDPILSSQKKTYRLPPLITYTDFELQFHPDPATIEIQ